MIQAQLNAGIGRIIGAVYLHGAKPEKKQAIGDILRWENGQYDVSVALFPFPDQHVTFEFDQDCELTQAKPLAAIIKTPTMDLRMEIGEVRPSEQGISKVHIYGVPTFPADLRF